ncbi:hypothetical protein [Mucilaginibacter koreensis]
MFKHCVIIVGLVLSATACNYSSTTKSATDTTAADSAPRDVTQADTEKVDTTNRNHAPMQGDGHPRGGME